MHLLFITFPACLYIWFYLSIFPLITAIPPHYGPNFDGPALFGAPAALAGQQRLLQSELTHQAQDHAVRGRFKPKKDRHSAARERSDIRERSTQLSPPVPRSRAS